MTEIFKIPMTERQERIQKALYDDLNSYRFTKINDAAAHQKLIALIKKIDKVFANELASMDIVVRDPKTGRLGKPKVTA